MENEIQLIKNFEMDSMWLKTHIDSIRSKFKNSFVAVKDKKVILSGKDLDALIEELKKNGVETDSVVIEYVPEKDIRIIY